MTSEKIVIYCNDLALLNGRIEEVKIGWSSICTNMSAKLNTSLIKRKLNGFLNKKVAKNVWRGLVLQTVR